MHSGNCRHLEPSNKHVALISITTPLYLEEVMRAMTSSKYNAHTNPLFKKMHLLKVGDIHTVQQLKNFYKLTQNNLPAYFNSFLIRRQHNIHEHLTRNRHMLVTEKVHHKFAEKCIRYSVFKTVNDTPTQIIDKMYTHSYKELPITQRIY